MAIAERAGRTGKAADQAGTKVASREWMPSGAWADKAKGASGNTILPSHQADGVLCMPGSHPANLKHLNNGETMQNPNDIQVGGDHYKSKGVQPWDYIVANNLGYMEGNIIKYVTRWRYKGGINDLEKARHYLDKLIATQSQTQSQHLCDNMGRQTES